MIIVKTQTNKIDISAALFATIASSFKLLKAFKDWLVTEKLGYAPAFVMLSFLLLFQFSLYEYDVDKYFALSPSATSKDESTILKSEFRSLKAST